MGQAAPSVLAHGGRNEMGVGSTARAEDRILLTVPITLVDRVIVGLMHVLVDAEIQLDRRIAGTAGDPEGWCRFGPRREAQLTEALDPVAAASLVEVGLATPFRLDLDLARSQRAGRDARRVNVFTAGSDAGLDCGVLAQVLACLLYTSRCV